MPLDASDRASRVTFLRVKASPTRNALGEVDVTDAANWEVLCSRWARVTTRGGREWWKVKQVRSEVTHAVTVLADSGTRTLLPTDRVRLSMSTTLDIAAVLPVTDGDRSEIEIQAILTT
jgi:head-tail adaptor